MCNKDQLYNDEQNERMTKTKNTNNKNKIKITE